FASEPPAEFRESFFGPDLRGILAVRPDSDQASVGPIIRHVRTQPGLCPFLFADRKTQVHAPVTRGWDTKTGKTEPSQKVVGLMFDERQRLPVSARGQLAKATVAQHAPDAGEPKKQQIPTNGPR